LSETIIATFNARDNEWFLVIEKMTKCIEDKEKELENAHEHMAIALRNLKDQRQAFPSRSDNTRVIQSNEDEGKEETL